MAVRREPAYGGYCKYYKQRSAKLELIELYQSAVCPWLKCAQVKQGGIPGVTVWSQDPRGSQEEWMEPECSRVPRHRIGEAS